MSTGVEMRAEGYSPTATSSSSPGRGPSGSARTRTSTDAVEGSSARYGSGWCSPAKTNTMIPSRVAWRNAARLNGSFPVMNSSPSSHNSAPTCTRAAAPRSSSVGCAAGGNSSGRRRSRWRVSRPAIAATGNEHRAAKSTAHTLLDTRNPFIPPAPLRQRPPAEQRRSWRHRRAPRLP